MTDIKEIAKLKCLPLLRALLLMGKQAILTDCVILLYFCIHERGKNGPSKTTDLAKVSSNCAGLKVSFFERFSVSHSLNFFT